MEIGELRNLSREELTERLKSAQEELFNLKVEAVQGRAANPSKIREAKIIISRIKTLLRERELKEERKT